MKIVFFGTSAFGIPCLEALQKEHALSAVITTPDKPKGRNLKLQPSPAKEWALSRNIPCFEMTSKAPQELAKTLEELKSDIFIVISFGVILPKNILELSKFPPLNVHSSLLPRHRGASPVQSAILSGDAISGVTIMRMVERLDAGDILLKKETPISETENHLELEDRLSKLSAPLLLQALQDLEKQRAVFTPQDESRSTYAKKISKSEGLVDWSRSASEISVKVRAYYGWPGSFTFFKKTRVILLSVSGMPGGPTPQKPGSVLSADQNGLILQTGSGLLKIESLQPEGKKPMSSQDFLRGHLVKIGDFFGE